MKAIIQFNRPVQQIGETQVEIDVQVAPFSIVLTADSNEGLDKAIGPEKADFLIEQFRNEVNRELIMGQCRIAMEETRPSKY